MWCTRLFHSCCIMCTSCYQKDAESGGLGSIFPHLLITRDPVWWVMSLWPSKKWRLVSEPCRCDPEWCPRTVLTKQQTTFPFVTLLLLKEWFLGACNMNFVIPPPLSLQLPFTPYPSLQLHPSQRPSTYTCRSPSQSNQAQAISSRFPIYVSQAENHLTEFY